MYYDSDQYNDFLMYLETCVVAIGLPIQYKDFLMHMWVYFGFLCIVLGFVSLLDTC